MRIFAISSVEGPGLIAAAAALRSAMREEEARLTYSIRQIEGIGPAMAAKLASIKIRTTAGLLDAASTAKGRKKIADEIGVDEQTVLRWANLADRMRVKGVREPYAELLRAAGVDTVRELKHRNVENLVQALAEANRKRKLVTLLPTEKHVKRWIDEAKKLSPKISYK
jgi:predicted RecB family nuclease